MGITGTIAGIVALGVLALYLLARAGRHERRDAYNRED